MAWGIGIAFHGFAVITESTISFKKWKSKKLQQYVEEEVEEFKRSNNQIKLETIEDFTKKEAYFRAKKRLDNLSGFYWHAVVYLVVNVFIFSILFFVADISFRAWYTYATAIFWGIGLAIHAISLFTKNIIFSKNWEQRKIEEYMRNDQQERWD
ncbi:2TM domain-containing protein [Seonamhaeicola marinus]|uniref:2TM domain-containing protein n=2 Tax=Seonamhaeicola marinus TaxID=1912246 RepID=A0A5D0ILR7_9FLAO|nr:2TM domain-containing protein [Seonamhaeicola marinus]